MVDGDDVTDPLGEVGRAAVALKWKKIALSSYKMMQLMLFQFLRNAAKKIYLKCGEITALRVLSINFIEKKTHNDLNYFLQYTTVHICVT